MMINRIQVLPELVINQIAAGEVIERPASILKELLENSIDANSSIIRIYLENGGVGGIKIVDNGIGIHPEDLPLVFKQHATSKIQKVSDLDSINSLGFRGEALASIAAISKVDIRSSQLEPTGTTIEVKDIFYNLPVRKKFLRSSTTEFNYIQEMFKRLALSNFSVGFMLYNNNKLIKSLPVISKSIISKSIISNFDNTVTNSVVNQGSLVNQESVINQELILKEQRLAKIVGNRFIENAFFFNIKANSLQLSGWISSEYDVAGSNIQYFYLNNRVVKDKLLNAAIRDATKKLSLPVAYCVYFKLDPMLVDINVHPTKQEVRFSDPKIIYAFIYESILDAFKQFKIKNRDNNLDDNYNNRDNDFNNRDDNLDNDYNNNRDNNENNSYINALQQHEINQKNPVNVLGKHEINRKNLDLDLNFNVKMDCNELDFKSINPMIEPIDSIERIESINIIDIINTKNLKILPIFNNKYLLFTGQLTEKILNPNELRVLNIKEGLQWLLVNSLKNKDKLIRYKLIIPERVKLNNEIPNDFGVIINLLEKFKFDITQIHRDVLLVKSIPEYFYFFEIQVDYGRFFQELFKMQLKLELQLESEFELQLEPKLESQLEFHLSPHLELQAAKDYHIRSGIKSVKDNQSNIDSKIINLLIDCIEFQDLSVYTNKDLIKLITVLIKENFTFRQLSQYKFEKMF